MLAGLMWRIDKYGQVDQARTADAIVVLGARVRSDGQPGSDLLSRTYHAMDLYQANLAQNIICTGGFADERLSAAAVACRFATDNGIPEDHVWLAAGTTNTAEDAASTARVMKEHGWKTAILVSHPLHLYRAAWHFRRAGIEVYPSPTTTSVGQITFPLRVYYDGREAVALLLSYAEERGMPREWISNIQAKLYQLNQSLMKDLP
jgi:uncharacterized SAM-binding protein YcdF (DUF218 family)